MSSNILKGMEVRFTPEQEARLAQIAANAGTDAERFVKDAALLLLENEAASRTDVLRVNGELPLWSSLDSPSRTVPMHH
ncbi:MAG: hypothetical protein JO170_19535 [Verrucomicrobia bacterium]|nr:hypothetical protein [Verrucomicrobiota bacterium]